MATAENGSLEVDVTVELHYLVVIIVIIISNKNNNGKYDIVLTAVATINAGKLRGYGGQVHRSVRHTGIHSSLNFVERQILNPFKSRQKPCRFPINFREICGCEY